MVSDPSVLLRPELDEWGSHGHRLSNAADLMKRCWQHNSSERLDRRSLKDELQKVK